MLKRLKGLTNAKEVGGSYRCRRGWRVLPLLKRLEGLTDVEHVEGSYRC